MKIASMHETPLKVPFMSKSMPLSTASGLPQGFGALMAAALRNLGHPNFYESMVEFVRQMIPCDLWIIARYDALSKPLIVSENGMNVNAKALYSDRMWQHDPLSKRTDQADARVFSLGQLRSNGTLDRVYARYVDSTLGIEDELALLFPISDGSFLALCLDRQGNLFSQEELALARELQTMLVEMHNQHILRAIDRQVSLFLHHNTSGKPEVMIMNANNTVLYQSDTWSLAAAQAFDREPQPAEIGSVRIAETSGRDGWSLTRLNDDCPDAILAGAEVYLLRRNSFGLDDRLSHFARVHQLTQRQQEILALSLKGYSNAAIAAQLNITTGGVKNHKLRLYEKLDITTERELISAVLSHL